MKFIDKVVTSTNIDFETQNILIVLLDDKLKQVDLLKLTTFLNSVSFNREAFSPHFKTDITIFSLELGLVDIISLEVKRRNYVTNVEKYKITKRWELLLKRLQRELCSRVTDINGIEVEWITFWIRSISHFVKDKSKYYMINDMWFTLQEIKDIILPIVEYHPLSYFTWVTYDIENHYLVDFLYKMKVLSATVVVFIHKEQIIIHLSVK